MLFSKAFDKAFTVIINYKQANYCSSKSPEYLSKYCDKILKKSFKYINEAEIDYKLSETITIFKYLYDKDIFQNLYKNYLAKRLLLQQSQSMDREEGMIKKLKVNYLLTLFKFIFCHL